MTRAYEFGTKTRGCSTVDRKAAAAVDRKACERGSEMMGQIKTIINSTKKKDNPVEEPAHRTCQKKAATTG